VDAAIPQAAKPRMRQKNTNARLTALGRERFNRCNVFMSPDIAIPRPWVSPQSCMIGMVSRSASAGYHQRQGAHNLPGDPFALIHINRVTSERFKRSTSTPTFLYSKSGDNKGTIRSDMWYLVPSKDVRRHRLISSDTIKTLEGHGRGREFESRRPRHSFSRAATAP
jgi:hypothetical protein